MTFIKKTAKKELQFLHTHHDMMKKCGGPAANLISTEVGNSSAAKNETEEVEGGARSRRPGAKNNSNSSGESKQVKALKEALQKVKSKTKKEKKAERKAKAKKKRKKAKKERKRKAKKERKQKNKLWAYRMNMSSRV